MFLISVMSIIYCDILYPSPLATHMREHAINLWVTKFTRHCKKQGPQSSMIRTIMTTVTVVFHQSPFTQDRAKVQKGIFSLDMAFTWFYISSKAVDTFSDKSGMYTQHLTLIMAQVPAGLLWVCLMPSYFELLSFLSEFVLHSRLEWLSYCLKGPV